MPSSQTQAPILWGINLVFPLSAIRCCACLMHSCTFFLASFISNSRWSTDGDFIAFSPHVVLGSFPINNLKGECFVVALGHELCVNWAIGRRSAQLSCCTLLQCHRYCSTHWLFLLDCPSICGWYADDMFCLIPSVSQRVLVNMKMNWVPLSVMSHLGMP